MSALNWIRSKAKTTVEVKMLGGKEYEITRLYFRGQLPFNMKAQLVKEAQNLENTETVHEKLLMAGKSDAEYWHTTYTVVA